MAYKQVIPAEGWYFVNFENDDPKKSPPLIARLAAWALRDDGSVIGLVGNLGPGAWKTLEGHGAEERLAEANITTKGSYKHISQLTDTELAKLRSLAPKLSNHDEFFR